jgi:hypothetical protein
MASEVKMMIKKRKILIREVTYSNQAKTVFCARVTTCLGVFFTHKTAGNWMNGAHADFVGQDNLLA